MSLSSDFLAAKHKSSHFLEGVIDTHPVLVTAALMAGLVVSLLLATRLLMQ